MDRSNAITPKQVSDEGLFGGKNMIILILIMLLIFSFLGINILIVSGNIYDEVRVTVLPVIEKVLAMFGYSSGILIDKTADTASDAIKFSTDIAHGAVDSIGDLLKVASKSRLEEDTQLALDQTLTFNKPLCKNEPQPESSSSSTQSPISSGKQKWCLVEEIGTQRNCLEIAEMDKCMSGQVFPSQKVCLNPNLTP
jgi:hypothetical protein